MPTHIRMERWTTIDELNYIRLLTAHTPKQARRLLKSYVYTAGMRRWWGRGMSVEPGVVILYAMDCLDILEKKGPVE